MRSIQNGMRANKNIEREAWKTTKTVNDEESEITELMKEKEY